MKGFSKKATKVFSVALATAVAVGAAVGVSISYAEENHIHTFSDVLSWDTKNHYYESNCGHAIITGAEAHDFENGKCTVCGYELPETEPEHVYTFDTEYQWDEVNHWHPSTSGDELVSEMAAHDFENGKCTVCGYEKPAPGHEHSFSEEWKYDELNHWHPSTCGDYIVKDIAKHVLVDGVCECGYATEYSSLELTAGAYSESLYVEFRAKDTQNVTVSYQLKGSADWIELDGELVRMIDFDTVRADAVGLKAGTYNVKVSSGNVTETKSDIEVAAYDRAGYAHFNATEGVGAYNNDGTPKDNAQIVYVTEETKNTVSVTWGSNTYTGIAYILANASKCPAPLIVRVIGRVAAATWNEIDYRDYYNQTADISGEMVRTYPYANGKQLSAQAYTQQELIDGGFNTLDTSVYSELKGLTSKMTYDSSKDEYDSAWNNCSVSGASNVTVEGIGTDAELFQWGMTFVNSNSIEVRNLTFDDYTEDACSFEGNSEKTSADEFAYKHFWIHNNTFNQGMNYWDVCPEQDKHEGDGATDFKRLSYVTISYNHYFENHKTGLIGAGDTSMTANVTFHHNYYEDCQSRMPLARQANMHMYNNYYYGSTGTNMSLRASAVALIEYCYFENAKYPVTVNDTKAIGALWNCIFIEGAQGSSTKFVEVANQIVTLSSRSDVISNPNNVNYFGGAGFYNDSSLFYFTSDEAIRANEYFIDTKDIPDRIPALAGVNK